MSFTSQGTQLWLSGFFCGECWHTAFKCKCQRQNSNFFLLTSFAPLASFKCTNWTWCFRTPLMWFQFKDSRVVLKTPHQPLKSLSISPSFPHPLFHHSHSLDVVFGPSCDVVWSHKAICRIISRGTPRTNCTVLGPAASGNGAGRATKTSKRYNTYISKPFVCWSFMVPPSTPAGRLSQAAQVNVINWSTLVLFVIATFFGGWTVLFTIYTSVRSHKRLQSILAGVKELWPVYCVSERGRHPINLLLFFSVLYQSKLNTLGFCAFVQPKYTIW